MSGYYGPNGWVDTTPKEDLHGLEGQTVDLPPAQEWLNPNQSTERASQQQENAVDTSVNIEDPNMLDRIFKALASKVVEASELGKRVAGLETELQAVKEQLRLANDNIVQERTMHAETRRELQEVQSKLNAEQRAVHDLVMERDIVIEERNAAQRERDEWKHNSDSLMRERDVAWQDVNQQRQHNVVLEERCNMLTQRLAAFKAAFAGLSDL